MSNGFHPDWWYATFLVVGVLLGLLIGRAVWWPE